MFWSKKTFIRTIEHKAVKHKSKYWEAELDFHQIHSYLHRVIFMADHFKFWMSYSFEYPDRSLLLGTTR